MKVAGSAYMQVLLQGGAVATGNGTAANLVDLYNGSVSYVTLGVSGITTATITIEASVDETNWYAVEATNLTNGAYATTITADGLYRVQTIGLRALRARISAYTTGTISVYGMLTA